MYGRSRDEHGRLLLVRGSSIDDRPGWWSLPGGGVEHGESPEAALIREYAEETGLPVTSGRLRSVLTDVVARPDRGEIVHTDRIIYDVDAPAGELRHEAHGSSDLAEWIEPDRVTRLPLYRHTARALGLADPADPVDRVDWGIWPAPAGVASSRREDFIIGPANPATAPAALATAPAPASASVEPSVSASVSGPVEPSARRQRFAAYGLVEDPDGRILLTRIAPGYPGAGTWHLPGGGTDFGESAVVGLVRELIEETGQRGRVVELLAASHYHNPAAVGPEGYPIDWHTIRALYRVMVATPGSPVVTEAAGGSTAEVGWFTRAGAAELPCNDFARSVLARY